MACKKNCSLLSYFLVVTMLLSFTQFIYAAREIQETTNRRSGRDVPLTTETIRGAERYVRRPQLPGGRNNINVPGSQYHRYIPGLDDTFIPNTGYEIPAPRSVHVSAAHP
ncbi:hypothetical protein AQUCO_05900028v1 [Aquilegia coerulea]|uniref:Uncharacterized protein n=1 Tax=Aquilegia coerulea TaxID=218851 RepID=A0A2G5CFA6_AQUCA|nr:hypothetical protein AQUCO_05900028v1 [Aquilegia coerulea]